VTFLLTDVENSTPAWDKAPDLMAEAVGRHYDLLDAAIVRHNGVRPVEQGEGDSLVAVFARASDAIRAALDSQRAIAAEPWPPGAEIAVRMALHTGEARLRDDLYYAGPSIIRCARLRSLGHGGQTLLSAITADLLAEALPDEAALLPLGVHRLKGLSHPEHVFQLVHPDLPARFPPLRSVDVVPSNLPAQLTSFVGREAELAELSQVSAQHRLVTLVGAGGTGKTRLAIEVAADAIDAYPNGVWWVDLATVADPGLVPRAVMTAVGLDDTHADPVARITTFLSDKRAMLVIDNCEHLSQPTGELVSAVLHGCPGVAVLATSREALGIAGEAVWRVPPLVLPEAIDRTRPTTHDVERILATEAVRLFAERAAEARPGFQVDGSNAATVAEICTRLDGLPLALELAAARVRALTPQRILDGLNQRFALLTGGAGGTPHQQTLAASMEWSHDLLSEPQRVLLRRLSVFTGRFTLDDVEVVAAAEPLTSWECLVLLADLVDRSLVAFDGDHYRLLQTVAAFAAGHLAAAGEETAVRAAHATHYAAVAATGAAELDACPHPETLDRLEVARDNMLAAIEHSLAVGDHERALAMTADLTTFWQMRGRYGESLTFLRRVLAGTPDTPSPTRARVLWGAGQQALFGMDLANGYGLNETGLALEMAEKTGALGVLARARCMRDAVYVFGRPELAVESLQAAADLADSAGDRFAGNLATVWLGMAATFGLDRGDVADTALRRLRAEADATGSPYWALWHAVCTGFAALHAGRLREAVDVLAPTVAQARDFGLPQIQFFSAVPLADAYTDLGEAGEAETLITHTAEWQDRSALGRAEFMLLRRGRLLLMQGDVAAAQAQIADVQATLRGIGFDFGATEFDLTAGRAAQESGDLAGARVLVDEAAILAEKVGMPWHLAWVAETDGRLARAEGRSPAAEDAHHRALAICLGHGYAGRAAETLESLASLAVAAESWTEAARLYGAAAARRDASGFHRPALDQPRVDDDHTELVAALGHEAYEAALAEGAAMPLEEAAAYATRARGERKRPSTGWESLTPTERQVVGLVAEGLTNADIGRRLFISTGTVKVHVHNIFGKLGITRRAELAARATERRLIES
jgi:predicted ATPase/class 3 adenylate cyclase/DNA-binding CsgD family transcriptional regulator